MQQAQQSLFQYTPLPQLSRQGPTQAPQPQPQAAYPNIFGGVSQSDQVLSLPSSAQAGTTTLFHESSAPLDQSPADLLLAQQISQDDPLDPMAQQSQGAQATSQLQTASGSKPTKTNEDEQRLKSYNMLHS